jgi:hypothetical protein
LNRPRLYLGKPLPRPLFAAGLVAAETPRERQFRRVAEFRAALEGYRRDEVTIVEARDILARVARMGRSFGGPTR